MVLWSLNSSSGVSESPSKDEMVAVELIESIWLGRGRVRTDMRDDWADERVWRGGAGDVAEEGGE